MSDTTTANTNLIISCLTLGASLIMPVIAIFNICMNRLKVSKCHKFVDSEVDMNEAEIKT